MKKITLIIIMIVNAIASYCQTKDVSILKNKVKEYLLKEYFSKCETTVDGNNLVISLEIDDVAKKSILEKLKGIYESNVKKKMIDSLDEMGLNSEPYEDIEFGKDLYGVDNPLFSIQKGWLTYLVATNPNFKGFADVFILYTDTKGTTLYNQTINVRLKEIAKQLSDTNMAEKEIAMLIAEKIGLDAGVIKNKEMTPYKLDFMTTMEDIEITDNSYIYYVSIPKYMVNTLSVSDYNNIKKDLDRSLGDYTNAMNFFDKKGAEAFGLKIIYVYQSSNDNEPFIKYVYNPYTNSCDIVPFSQDIIEKFSIEEFANKDFEKWAELKVFEAMDNVGLGALPKLKIESINPLSITAILGMKEEPQFLIDRGYKYFLSIGDRVSKRLSTSLKQSNLNDKNYEITVIFKDTTNNKEIIRYIFYPSKEDRFEVIPISDTMKKLQEEETLACSDLAHWLLIRSKYAIKSIEYRWLMKLQDYKVIKDKEICLDVTVAQSEIPCYTNPESEDSKWLQNHLYSDLEYDRDEDQLGFLSDLKVSHPAVISIRLLDGVQNQIINELKIIFPNENGGYSD